MNPPHLLMDPCWRRATLEEMKAIEDNEMWYLADLPLGRCTIGLKWIFKVKRNEEGTVVRHKARLVVKGYAQRHKVDYDEVFAPFARLYSIRVLIAPVAHKGWEVHHLDVKSTFLNGDLQEEVYMEQPAGFVKSDCEHKVLQLQKVLYGLHQVSRAWNVKLDDTLLSLGFRRSSSELTVYTRQADGEQLVVGVYVDDLMITGSNCNNIKCFKSQMAKVFNMSDLGHLHYYLGIEVKQSAGGISLGHSSYALKIVEKCGLADCNPCFLPMENCLKLSSQSNEAEVDKTLYRSIVGSLRYLVNTRPDLGFAVEYISRFLEDPREDHMAAVKHIVCYVAGTLNWGMWFSQQDEDEAVFTVFSESDYVGDLDK
jgi:hypothetical protein